MCRGSMNASDYFFWITVDRNKIESCGFHHWREEMKAHWIVYYRLLSYWFLKLFFQLAEWRKKTFLREKEKAQNWAFLTEIARKSCWRFDWITYYLSRPSAVRRASISGLNLYLILENSLSITYQIALFLKRSIENLTINK
jgi:hypothetical protein